MQTVFYFLVNTSVNIFTTCIGSSNTIVSPNCMGQMRSSVWQLLKSMKLMVVQAWGFIFLSLKCKKKIVAWEIHLETLVTLWQKMVQALIFKWKSESCSVMSDSLWPHEGYSPCNSPGKNTGVGSYSFLQGILPTQGSNPGLLHCGWILCQLSHQGSPRILEWVAYPFSSGSSQPRNLTWVFCIASRFFTNCGIMGKTNSIWF